MKKNKHLKAHFCNPELKNPCMTLYANLRFANLDNPYKTIAVTSAGVNEGKTTIATNLASAIAISGRKTLIVDTDMRHRCIYKMLDKKNNLGLYSLLINEYPIKEVLQPTFIDHLYFLDTESNIPSPPDVLSTRRFANLVKTLRQQFDYIIFDTPPLSTFVDASIISNIADATILTVRQGKTKHDAVKNALDQLSTAKANVIGSVLTFTKDSQSEYYYAYYNKEGQRVKHEDYPNYNVVKDGF